QAESTLDAILGPLDLGGRAVEIGSTDDPAWSYYHGFLFPDSERQQWMNDRRLVELLQEQGDDLTTARQVDHMAYFPTASRRDAFVRDTRDLGFEVLSASSDHAGELPYAANIARDENVTVDGIHDVVMILVQLAGRYDGDYDGWGTVAITR